MMKFKMVNILKRASWFPKSRKVLVWFLRGIFLYIFIYNIFCFKQQQEAEGTVQSVGKEIPDQGEGEGKNIGGRGGEKKKK